MSSEIGTLLHPKSMPLELPGGGVPSITPEIVAAALFGSPQYAIDLFMLYHSPEEGYKDGSGIARTTLIRQLRDAFIDTRAVYTDEEKGTELQRQLVALGVSEIVDNYKCPACKGTEYISNKTCPECRGSGEGFKIENEIRWIYAYSVIIPQIKVCQLRPAHHYARIAPKNRIAYWSRVYEGLRYRINDLLSDAVYRINTQIEDEEIG